MARDVRIVTGAELGNVVHPDPAAVDEIGVRDTAMASDLRARHPKAGWIIRP
jgi:hypothetical protein